MDKRLKSSRQIVLICLVIVVAFASIMFTISSFKNTSAYVEQTTDMTAINVMNNIHSSMEGSVQTARIMAGNSFVIDWAEKEAEHTDDSDYFKKLYNYLKL